MKKQIITALIMPLILSACASGSASPGSASTLGVLRGDVGRYMVDRRAALQQLRSRAATLNEVSLSKAAQLNALEKKLALAVANDQNVSAELNELYSEVVAKKAAADLTYKNASELEGKVISIEQNIETANNNQQQDEASIESLNVEITRLELQNAGLDIATFDTLELKSIQLIENSTLN